MSHLFRHLAPVPDEAWSQIDQEARRVLVSALAARRLVDFRGPLGWTAGSVPCGRIAPEVPSPVPGVKVAPRQVLPLVELRAPFVLDRAELENAARGATNLDLDPLVQAAIALARAEDRAVFLGLPAAEIGGICPHAVHARAPLTDDCSTYAEALAQATSLLRSAGVDGPFALALGARSFTALEQATKQGYPVLDLVRKIVGGPIVWAPAIDGGILLSQRGGDFELTVGQDVAVGYAHHTATEVSLYLVETLAFQVLTADAAVCLEYAS